MHCMPGGAALPLETGLPRRFRSNSSSARHPEARSFETEKACTLSRVGTEFYARRRYGCLSEGNLCRGRRGVGLDLEDEEKRCVK